MRDTSVPVVVTACRCYRRPRTRRSPTCWFIVCDDLNTRVSTSGYPHTGEQLYDLTSDPDEESNLADIPQHGDTLKEIRVHLNGAETRALAKKR